MIKILYLISNECEYFKLINNLVYLLKICNLKQRKCAIVVKIESVAKVTSLIIEPKNRYFFFTRLASFLSSLFIFIIFINLIEIIKKGRVKWHITLGCYKKIEIALQMVILESNYVANA